MVAMCDTDRSSETLEWVATEVSEAFHDAGSALGDVGDMALDHVNGSDARAEPPTGLVYSAKCDKEWVQTLSGSGYSSTTTTYYSNVKLPGLAPRNAPLLSVVLCDYVAATTGPACPNDWQCSGWEPPHLACVQASYANLGDGEAVVPCGTVISNQATTSGGHWQNAYVRVQ